MWVRLGMFPVKAGQAEALRKAHLDKALPHVRKQPGLVANMLMEPVKEGDPFVAITVWATRHDGETYENSGAASAVVGMLKDFIAGLPTVQAYETHSHTLPLPGNAATVPPPSP